MACPKCKKGFFTMQKNIEVETLVFANEIIKEFYYRYYSFCSNIMCDWKNIRRELFKTKKTRRNND